MTQTPPAAIAVSWRQCMVYVFHIYWLLLGICFPLLRIWCLFESSLVCVTAGNYH